MATIAQPLPALQCQSPHNHKLSMAVIVVTFSSKSISLFSPSTGRPFKLYSSLNPDSSDCKPPAADPVKLAFEKAKAYKKFAKITTPSSADTPFPISESGSSTSGDFLSVKMALERAEDLDGVEGNAADSTLTLSEDSKADKKAQPSISAIDFMGLNFADKKKGRGLPAGLMPLVDPLDVPDSVEVEFIAGNLSETAVNGQREDDGSEIYKPKVSTWGVFPRPGNISKTFGGGRTIRPGEVLETEEDRAAKDAKTRQLLAAYKARAGMNIDPKLKSECEKAVNDGDSLMNRGKLKEALPFYEDVMKKLTFKSELHGVAALQWSICQDSLSRSNEARIMYEKLQSHPNYRVSKAAREFMFGFQAMEMMKVKSARTPSMSTGYQNYFEAFLENKPDYALKEAGTSQSTGDETLPYIFFLASPLLIMLIISLRKVVN
uniref:Uncharacterized protein n=1 Tax=Kalanchoe fedtschenkoi TaxID=63787 RepID=A0A7N0RAS5_KALFE